MAGAGVAAVRRAYRRSAPVVSGRFRLDGLDGPVEVVRDDDGLPHVRARSERDAMAAQGWCHAQDRLWQMELVRRIVRGRLAELVGAAALDGDRYLRTLGLARVADAEAAALTDEDRAAVEAYCVGVNAYLRSPAYRCPLELRLLLRRGVSPWTPGDALLPAKLLALNLGANFEAEVVRARLVERLGAERLAQLEPAYTPGPAPPLPEGAAAVLRQARKERMEGGPGAVGSNNWVLAGHRTATGAPLLANDPHLLLGLPAAWYAIDVDWGAERFVGFSLAGLPGIVIGQNAHVAWGFTNVGADTQDLFAVDLDREPSRQRQEVIRVRGRRTPHVEWVRETRHGPVVTPLVPDEPRGLALRWTALEPCGTIRALRGVARARSGDDVVEAMRSYGGAILSMVYADRAGRIGFHVVGGPIPIRGRGDGLTPQPGDDPAADWQGTIPYEELPALRDPGRGAIVTANASIVPDGYPYLISKEWLNPYRHERIDELLEAGERLTVADLCAMQIDVRSLPGRRLRDLLAAFPVDGELEGVAQGLLAAWDGELAPDSAGGAVYGVLVRHLILETFAEADDEVGRFLGGPGFSMLSAALPFYRQALPTLLDLLARRDDRFFLDGRTWRGVVQVAFGRAARELERRAGRDPRRWRWGDLHPLVLDHPLAALPGAARLFRRGPLAVGGDADTVAQAYSSPGDAEQGRLVTGAGLRFVADVADPGRSRYAVAGGQSGHPASPHYDDGVEGWLRGGTRAIAWSPEAIERRRVATLLLTP